MYMADIKIMFIKQFLHKIFKSYTLHIFMVLLQSVSFILGGSC